MSDFKSLKGDPSFAGSLLRSAVGDAPSARARRLAAASVGLVATTSVVPSALAAGQALGTTTTVVVVPAGVKSISALMVSKWLASSFLVGLVATGGVVTVYEVAGSHTMSEPTERTAPMPPRAAVEMAPARKQTPVLAQPAAEGDEPAATPPSGGVPASGATASRVLVAPPRVAPQPGAKSQQASTGADATSLDAEIAWLEPARRALQTRNGGQALAALDRATPHVRLLASEAVLLRVEALLLVGHRAEAERLAAPFLNRHSSSPHAQRLRGLLEQL